MSTSRRPAGAADAQALSVPSFLGAHTPSFFAGASIDFSLATSSRPRTANRPPFFRKDHRHAVVDRLDHRVRGGGEDRERTLALVGLRLPRLAQTGEGIAIRQRSRSLDASVVA
jgi:hypothetical protein